MKQCKGCAKRFVGCHSQCQIYIVNKVINTYKREKVSKEKDLTFNTNYYDRICREGRKKLDGFQRGAYSEY